MTADARRQQVLIVATSEFARAGYYGASTQTIAELAGLSQPYLFQLFGSKMKLFMAVWNECSDRIETVLREAALGVPIPERGHALASAYDALLSNERDLLTLQLQAWSASCTDDEIRDAVASRFNGIWDLVSSLSSAPSGAVSDMMGGWVLYNVAAALRIERIDDCTVSGAWERSSADR